MEYLDDNWTPLTSPADQQLLIQMNFNVTLCVFEAFIYAAPTLSTDVHWSFVIEKNETSDSW